MPRISRRRSRLPSLSDRPKRARGYRHILAFAVAASTGLGALLLSSGDGDANIAPAGPDGRSTQSLSLPSADGGATQPEGREPLRVLNDPAPARVVPPDQSSAGDARNGESSAGLQPATLQAASLAPHASNPMGDRSSANATADTVEPVALPTDTPPPSDVNTASLAWDTYEVRSGDSLAALFSRAGLSARDVHEVVNADEQARALTQLYPGDEVRIALDGDGGLEGVRYELNETETLTVRQDGDGYSSEISTVKLTARRAQASGTIRSSLYAAALGAGLSDRQIMQLASIFGWDIDFALDLRKGDQFRVLYEELYRDGEKVRNGDILAAEFVNQGDRFRAVRFTFPDGDSQYFTPEGKSMRKAFLRTPLNFTRVSSDFNPERLHPIYGTKRPHMGTDYAAPPGTPIKAAGDGKIIHIGRKGGYGNTIILQHGSRYTTLYAHMKGFRRGLTHGNRVQQGDVIGYVGSTGLSTGPHLHYEFRVDGRHRNPRTVELPEAQPIPAEHRPAFEEHSTPLVAALEAETPTRLARTDTETDGNATQ
ncbi:OapA family protein [Arhodomonas sp. SL1]|uniref:OapA family protein n=1 Tax=Arhodomonas sp. SL1 TaxID=3425691 RepID=UPI003F8819A5